MKCKLISLVLTIMMLCSICNIGMVFSEDEIIPAPTVSEEMPEEMTGENEETLLQQDTKVTNPPEEVVISDEFVETPVETSDETSGQISAESPDVISDETSDETSKFEEWREENKTHIANIKVIKGDGSPIAGAEVKLGGQASTTDQDGIALFDGLEPGYEHIELHAGMYRDKTTTMQVPELIEDFSFVVVMQEEDSEAIAPLSDAEGEIDPQELLSTLRESVSSTWGVTYDDEVTGAMVPANGKIYNFPPGRTIIYDINTNKWSIATGAPRNGGTYAVVPNEEKKIYLLGDKEVVQIYDISTDTWTLGERATSNMISANLVGSRIYCYDAEQVKMYIYDINGDYWTVKKDFGDIDYPNLRVPSEKCPSAVYGTKIYYTGIMHHDNETANSLYIYDTTTHSWSRGSQRPPSPPVGCGGGNFISLGGFMIYQGGQSYYFEDENLWDEHQLSVYLPLQDEWYILSPDLIDVNISGDMEKWEWESACAYDGKIYFRRNYDVNGAFTKYAITNVRDAIRYNQEFELDTVDSGDFHAIKVNGKTIYTMGDNTYGQLGNGTTISSEKYTVAMKGECYKVAAGANSSYALCEQGLYAWGDNSYGQLGDGTLESKTSPVLVMDDAVDIAAGDNHVLVLKNDGTVWGFGDNSDHQLTGVVSTSIQTTPTKIYYYADRIIAGGNQSFIFDDRSNLLGCGRNDRGQLGLGNTEEATSFEYIASDYIAASAGKNHTVALDKNFSAYAWGDNTYGQVKDTPGSPAIILMHERLTDGGKASIISASGNNTIFIFNQQISQRGENTPYNTIIANMDGIMRAKAGAYSFAINKYGQMYRWGRMTADKDSAKGSLEKIDYPYAIRRADSYRQQTIAIDQAGNVIAWGTGYFANDTQIEMTNGYPKVIDGLYNVIQVARGKNHNLALDINGNVYGWGSNSNYAMGYGDGKFKTPLQIKGIEQVKQITAGDEFSVFLKKDGTIWAVGKNDKGQLGQGNINNASVPVQVGSKSNYTYVTAGADYVVAIADDGIYAWGSNENGRLGIMTSTLAYSTPTKQPAVLSGNEKFVRLEAGPDYCYALTNLGNVYAWGKNNKGQLGIGGTTNHILPTKVKALSDVKYIKTAYTQGYAIKNNGDVYAWGAGSKYQLGINNTSNVTTPAKVTSLSGKNIEQIVGGDGYANAITADGTVYSFGDKSNGSLGTYAVHGTNINYFEGDLKTLQEYMNQYGYELTEDIVIPEYYSGNAEIIWTSDNEAYLTTDGVVNRPDIYTGDVLVTLTAQSEFDDYLGEYKLRQKFQFLIPYDPNLKPSTDIPIRTIGMEFDQTYELAQGVQKPDIFSVTIKPINESGGEYELYVKPNQYTHDPSGSPFFFWSSREGTFTPVYNNDDYSCVRFKIDPNSIGSQVKVTVGIGDNLGYMSKKYFLVGSSASTVAAQTTGQENIITMAMNEQLSSDDISENGIHLIMGLDTSSAMQEFDTGSTKTWMDNIEGMIDSSPDNTSFSIVTTGISGTEINDKQSAKNSLELIRAGAYTGSGNALSILEKCALTTDNNRDNIIVITAVNTGDLDLLKEKIAEIESSGTAVYIMLVDSDESILGNPDEYTNISVCKTELDLRLNLSEIYGALNVISEASGLSSGILALNSTGNSSLSSDFKPDKHAFTGASSYPFGAAIASILNIYSSLPAKIENGYDIINGSNLHHLSYGNAVSVTGASSMLSYWNDMHQEFKLGSGTAKTLYVTGGSSGDIYNVINDNLKYRFPVCALSGENVYLITGKGTGGRYYAYDWGSKSIIELSNVSSVIDTYAYLLEISKQVGMRDVVNENEEFYSRIRFTCPANYTSSDIKGYTYQVDGSGNISSAFAQVTPSVSFGFAELTYLQENSCYAFAAKASMNGVIPNVYNSVRQYKVIRYYDLASNNDSWYYPYLFKATNLGIINGNTDPAPGVPIGPEGSVYFNADSAVTREQFFKMAIQAGDINMSGVEYNANDGWAAQYIAYMKTVMGDIYGSLAYARFEEEIPRAEAAHVIKTLYLDQASNMRNPSSLYSYARDTRCDQVTKWNNSTGITYSDKTNSLWNTYEESIFQMYVNSIIIGTGDSYDPSGSTTRAQASKIITKCLFSMDEGLEKVRTERENEKTVYIVLYDSDLANHDTESAQGNSRYLNASGGSYEYDTAFFEKYFEMIGNKKVGFIISVRDLDFDANTTGYNQYDFKTITDITDFRMDNVIGKSTTRVVNIINNMKTALANINKTNTNKLQMPDIYIGTPHTYTNESHIQNWESENPAGNQRQLFLDRYKWVSTSIYNGIAAQVGEENITGIYFGREDPDEMYNQYGGASVTYQNMSNISDFAHERGKKIMWVPYSIQASQWYNIGIYANTGKSVNNSQRDLFDIVMMQPGLFYSNYTEGLEGINNYDVSIVEGNTGYNDQKRKVKDLLTSTQRNEFVLYGGTVGGAKTTNTLVSFEIEYDISLVTGRRHYDDAITPVGKGQNFLITYEYYKDLINNNTTSYAIYPGGSNEQNYKDISAQNNNNQHNFINHPSYLAPQGSEWDGNYNDEGNRMAYSYFYNKILDRDPNAFNTKDYNKLIYDMTYGLLYGEYAFTQNCKDYLGW